MKTDILLRLRSFVFGGFVCVCVCVCVCFLVGATARSAMISAVLNLTLMPLPSVCPLLLYHSFFSSVDDRITHTHTYAHTHTHTHRHTHRHTHACTHIHTHTHTHMHVQLHVCMHAQTHVCMHA